MLICTRKCFLVHQTTTPFEECVMLKKFSALTLMVFGFFVGIDSFVNHHRKTEETGANNNTDQSEISSDGCKTILEIALTSQERVKHLRETGWLLSKPSSDLIFIRFVVGLFPNDAKSEWSLIGIEDSYALVTEKIKEDFPEAIFMFNSQDLVVYINHTGEVGDELLTLEFHDDFEFESIFEVIGTPKIENADKVIERTLVAWTRARHPAISNHCVEEYVPADGGLAEVKLEPKQ